MRGSPTQGASGVFRSMARHDSLLAMVALTGLLWAEPAHAYIGPGAGFAFAGSFLVLIATFFLAFGTILVWPFLWLYRTIKVGNPYKKAQVQRVIVLGLDGLDPGIATRLMEQGKLPTFAELADRGAFRPLATTYPSMSPVAWSTFTTGVDPSRHAIYDFLDRNPKNYGPRLSSTDIGNPSRILSMGGWRIPLGKPRLSLLQRSQPFWKHLGMKHVFSIIQRMPITWPAQPVNGLLLSAMCVPDLRGSQGTFSFFSTETRGGGAAFEGGEQTVLRRNPKTPSVIRSRIVGPDNSLHVDGGRMLLPFTITVAQDKASASVAIEGHDAFTLEPGVYSDWIELIFSPGLGIKVHGIARFYFTSIDPEVNLYMTAIHIDPENPAMPISHPATYSMYLARKQGKFATLGLAEDTWALNEMVIEEKVFWDQAWLYFEERKRMFLDACKQTKRGLVTTVVDTTDRCQHMFMRYLDPTHPANEGKDTTEWAHAIDTLYQRMDGLLNEVRHEWERDDTLFLVVSDHGFTNFRRSVNLNAWLRDHGYLFLNEGVDVGGDWFEGVDWSRTRAYAMGLTGLFINLKGREGKGIVEPGEEYDSLVHEICAKLLELEDPENGQKVVRTAKAAAHFYTGPYKMDAPDVLVGWDGGYRHGWNCATGSTPVEIFSDNTKGWSGDHCVDPAIVPGVLFSNRPITTDTPRLLDMAPSIMRMLGQEPPKYMLGHSVFPEPGQQGEVKGWLDPAVLAEGQRCAAPLARIPSLEAASEAGDDTEEVTDA